MAEHKLYRQFENTSPLFSSLSEEISPVRDVHPSALNTPARMRYNKVKSRHSDKKVKSRRSDKSVTNESRGNEKTVTNQKTNISFSDPLPDEDWDSDDSFYDYRRRGPKLPYSAKEDEWILKFVLKGQNIFKVGSLSLWKHLESKKENPKRTYQSLKNRFLRTIKPQLFSRYRHLITSNVEIERILTKFPELKSKVGRTNTLSRIQLPARKPNSKFAEGELVNGSRDNDKKVTSPRPLTSAGSPNGSARREPILNFHFSNFERKVTITDKSLAVCVNFSSKEELHKPVIPSIGIYEKYKKFKKKNKLVLCTACGRYNQPRKNKLLDSGADEESLNISAGRDVLTTNSLSPNPGKSSVTNSASPPAKHRKTGECEPRLCTPFSPSLLNDGEEEHDLPVGWGTPDRPQETSEAGRAPGAPNSIALRQETDSAAADRLREADDDLDSTYDDTVTDFKKLIENEEERMLVRKCLYGKGGVLGLSDSISQMSMESYFVELSPNLETPELTIDYSNQSRTHISERDNSSSLLARNMMKMLEESKTSKES